MLKKMIMFVAVASLLFAVAPAAQAGPVPVANGDFELVGPASGQSRTVDILDFLADGSLDGHLQNAGQPCGPWDAQNWTVNEGGLSGDTWGTDSRWGDWWSSWTCGPTNGVNTIIADNRSWEGGGRVQHATMSQDIGSVADVIACGGPQVAFSLDARYEGSGEDSDDYFKTYIQVGGVAQTAGEFLAVLDASNPIPTWADLGDPRTGYGTAVKANPGVVKAGTEGPQNMGTFTATADLTGMDDAARVEIWIVNHRENNGTSGSPTNRIYIDNARVTAVPEPATMALLAFGGLGALIRRKRR